MDLEEYYMTNRYHNNNKIQEDKNFEYNSQENYEKFDAQDNLYEKMETTLNTFIKNLKKDDFSNYSSTNYMNNMLSNQGSYNIKEKNRNNNYYISEFNLVDPKRRLSNQNLNNFNNNMQVTNFGENSYTSKYNNLNINNIKYLSYRNSMPANYMSYDHFENINNKNNLSPNNNYRNNFNYVDNDNKQKLINASGNNKYNNNNLDNKKDDFNIGAKIQKNNKNANINDIIISNVSFRNKKIKNYDKDLQNVLKSLKKLNITNLENKKEVLNLQEQYMNMYKNVISQIQDYSINLQNIYDQKIKQLDNKGEKQIDDKKIVELNEIIEKLKSENNNLLNEQKNNSLNLTKFEKEKEKLQKENYNLNEFIKKLKEQNGFNNKDMSNLADKEYKIIELQNEKKELLNNIQRKDIIIKELYDKNEKLSKEIDKFKNIMKDVKITVENEEIMQNNLIDLENKYNKLKTDYDLIYEEKKSFLGQMNILRSQKNIYCKEFNKNKEILSQLKNDYDVLIKERDQYKKQKDIIKNELEIIKKNNDKMNAIKVNNNIKAQSNKKLRNTITDLNSQKSNLEKQNDLLQKKIEDLDKEIIRSKSQTKLKLLNKSKTFKNLKKINDIKFTIKKNENKKLTDTKNNKSKIKNCKNTK